MPELDFVFDGALYLIESDQYNVTMKTAPALDGGKAPANAVRKGYGAARVVGYFRDFSEVARWFAREGFNSIPGPLEEAAERWAEEADAFLEAVREASGNLPIALYKEEAQAAMAKAKKKAAPKKPTAKLPKPKIKFRRPK